MIPNVKKEMFLALVPVLQRNRHPRTFKMKSNLKQSSRMIPKRLQIFIHANITVGKNLPRTTTFT